jgi:uncharacterized protein YbaR (Trm112 family)
MRRGFLDGPSPGGPPALSPEPEPELGISSSSAPQQQQQQEEEEECPICLEPLSSFEASEVTRLRCAHVLCQLCLVELYHVQQATPSTHGQLTCPLCRTSHPVGGGNITEILRQLSTTTGGGVDGAWGSGALSSLSQRHGAGVGADGGWVPSAAESVRGLGSLRPSELVAVAASLGAHSPFGGWIDRREVEAAVTAVVLDAVGDEGGAGVLDVADLPIKALKTLLALRCVPCDDCVERGELVLRVRQTPRGSCMGLPSAVLTRMLGQLGVRGEHFVEKQQLARRVMAARAEDRKRRQQPQRQPGAQPVAEGRERVGQASPIRPSRATVRRSATVAAGATAARGARPSCRDCCVVQ